MKKFKIEILGDTLGFKYIIQADYFSTGIKHAVYHFYKNGEFNPIASLPIEKTIITLIDSE